jgi:hypothetical protein
MKYLMLVCVDPAVELPAEERATIGPEVDAWIGEMDRRGVRVQGQEVAAKHPVARFLVDYYLTAEEARRDAPRLRKGPPATYVERRGNVTIDWLKYPSARLRQITSVCAFG